VAAVAFTNLLRFDEIPASARGCPGLYEIWYGRVRLKVGIAGDLAKRLRQHANSLQRRLKGPRHVPWTDSSVVLSKSSILAKHLYFDRSIEPQLDLRTEEGRRSFLAKCHVRLEYLPTREDARQRERVLERRYRYR